MGKLRSLASDTAYYGLSSIVGRAINFLLLPFYTSPGILTEGQFGEVGDIYAKIAFLNIIYLFGLETTYFRFISGKNLSESRVFNNAQSFILLISILLSGLLFLFDTAIAQYFELHGKEIYLRLAASIIFVDAIVALPFAKLRYQRKARKFAIFKLVNIGINVVVNIVLLYVIPKIAAGEWMPQMQDWVGHTYDIDQKAKYVLIANLLANSCYLLMFHKTLWQFKLGFQSSTIRNMLKYAYPLVLTGLAGVTNEMFSRAMFIKLIPDGYYKGLNSSEALGVFVAVYRLSIFMTLAIQAFRYAAEPFFFRQSEDKDSRKTFAQVFHYFVIVGSAAIIGVGLNLDLLKIPLLRNEVYWQGLHVVPILLTANFLLGIYYNFSIWFKLTDKTHFGTFVALTGAIITVGLNIIFIPLYGFTGSAVVTLIVYLYMVVVTYFIGQKHYPVPYNLTTAGLYIGLALLLLCAGWFIDVGDAIANQAIKEVMVIIFLVFVYLKERKRFPLKIN